MDVLPCPMLLAAIGPSAERARAQIAEALPARSTRSVRLDVDDGEERLEQTLVELFRVGSGLDVGRLDAVLVVELDESSLSQDQVVSALVRPCATLVKVLRRRFGAMLATEVGDDQRRVVLHIVVMAPPMLQDRATAVVLHGLRALERWVDVQPAHQVLSRIWVLSRQTLAATLTQQDVETQAVALVLGLWHPAARGHDAVRARIQPAHASNGRIAFAAGGMLEVPLSDLREHGRLVSAWEALDTLVRRVQQARGKTEPDLPTALRLEEAMEPFLSGSAATGLRSAAGSVGRDGGGLAGETAFVRDLVDPALGKLESAEMGILAQAESVLDVALRSDLSNVRPLDRVPGLDLALEQVARRLDDASAADSSKLTLAVPKDELPQEAPAPTAAVPIVGLSPWLMGCASGFSVLLAVLRINAAPSPTGSTLAATQVASTALVPPTYVWSDLLPWVAAGVIGTGSGVAWNVWMRRQIAAGLVRELPISAGERGGLLAADIVLRSIRMRIRRDLGDIVRRARGRLATVRQVLVETRDAVGGRLIEVGVDTGAALDHRALEPVLRSRGMLHAPLLGSETVWKWMRDARKFNDEDAWADEVVARTLPPDGCRVSVPACSVDDVVSISEVQVAGLDGRSPLDEVTAIGDLSVRFGQFVRRVARQLERACAPEGTAGGAANGIRAGELLVIAPVNVRRPIEEVMKQQSVAAVEVWVDTSVPRVILLRTWEGYRVDEIAQGLGVKALMP